MAKAKTGGVAAEIEAMKAIGMTDAEIRAKLIGPAVVAHADGGSQGGSSASQANGAVSGMPIAATPPQLTQPQRADGANLGPDQELVARHQAFLATYKPPVLEKEYEVILPTRVADYVERWAGLESSKRPNSDPITPEKAIELIIRRYWQNDPDRHMLGIGRARTAPAHVAPATWA